MEICYRKEWVHLGRDCIVWRIHGANERRITQRVDNEKTVTIMQIVMTRTLPPGANISV